MKLINPKLIIFTCSDDGTVDRIEPLLRVENLRINLDRPDTWSFEASPNHWRLMSNEREITDTSNAYVWWWKAFLEDFNIDEFLKAEIEYTTRELYRELAKQGLSVGNDFLHHEFRGKLHYLKSAQRFFRIPESLISQRGITRLSTNNVVVKSLTSSAFSSKKVLYTTRVGQDQLDFENFWFLQEYIDSEWDVTVVILGDKFFGFQRKRSGATVDWRKEQNFRIDSNDWIPVEFSAREVEQFTAFARAENLGWGRIDLLRSGSGELIFLELNANGQFGFLDPRNEFGLFTAVADLISEFPLNNP